MIHGDDFVWMHFPKCAGTKIGNIFNEYFSGDSSIVQDEVDGKARKEVFWHDSIVDREKRDDDFFLAQRTVICSFRRLPSWLESKYNFEILRSPDLDHDPARLLETNFLEANGYCNHADYYARKYLPEELLDSVEIIRTECFQEDFNKVFGKFIDVSLIPADEFERKANSTPPDSFVPEEIRKELYENADRLYTYAPHWKKIEDLFY